MLRHNYSPHHRWPCHACQYYAVVSLLLAVQYLLQFRASLVAIINCSSCSAFPIAFGWLATQFRGSLAFLLYCLLSFVPNGHVIDRRLEQLSNLRRSRPRRNPPEDGGPSCAVALHHGLRGSYFLDPIADYLICRSDVCNPSE